MAVYILEDRSTAIEFVPPEPPTSATLSIKTPSGTALEAPTVTVDSTSTTIGATVTTSTQFQVGAALTPGRQYWWTSVDSTSVRGLVRCAEYDSPIARLESPPPGSTVQQGDTITGARLTATVTSTGSATRDLNHQAVWTVTGTDGIVRIYQQALHVVRCLFRQAVLPADATRYLAGAFPHQNYDRPFGYFSELARRASRRVERKLLAGGRFQHLVGDHDIFADAGIVALRIELALEGMVPPGYDPTDYVAKTEKELGDAIQEAIAGCWYDIDDDGGVDEETERSGFYSMAWVRR